MKRNVVILTTMAIVMLLLIGNVSPSVLNVESNPATYDADVGESMPASASGDDAWADMPDGDFKDWLLSYFGDSEHEMSYPSDFRTLMEGFDPMNPASVRSIFEQLHGIDEAWALGYTGDGMSIAIVDTGVDFAHPDLHGTWATVGNMRVVNETVISSYTNETWVHLRHNNIVPGSQIVYENSTVMPGANYTLDTATGNLSFTSPPLIIGKIVNVSYTYVPKNIGWPVAFDPSSMSKLIRDNTTQGTWYANTSRHGPGPFDIIHNIEVDGTRDFFSNELYGTDPRDDDVSKAGGDKSDYDLTDLYVTRDDHYWYLGMPTYPQRGPPTYGSYDFPSYGIYFDVDDGATGTATVDPKGNKIDTLTSHSGHVTDVKYSPDGTLLATASKDRTIKIWNVATGACVRTLGGYVNTPWSVDWSPDGNYLVTADRAAITVWNPNTGQQLLKDEYINIDFDSTVGDSFYAPFTKSGTVSISHNSTWAAVSTKQNIYIYNLATLEYFGKIYVSVNDVNTIAFHPTQNWIAAGLQESDGGEYLIKIFDLANLANMDYSGAMQSVAHRTLLAGGHTEQVVNLAWHPTNANSLASVCKNDLSSLIVWNVDTSAVVSKVDAADQLSPFLDVAWSNDGNRLITAERGTFVTGFPTSPSLVIRDNVGNAITTINRNYSINSIDFSPTQNEFFIGSNDRRATLYGLDGAEKNILTAHRVNFAVYFNSDLVFNVKDQVYEPAMLNATFHTWNGAAWNELPLNNITWPVTGEVMIASYSDGISDATFAGLSNFAYSSIATYNIFKNGAPWQELGNYTVDMETGVLSLTLTADIENGDTVTANYEYRTPGMQAHAQLGITMFNEFAIPRFALGNPTSIKLMAFSVGRDNITHAQDTVPSDIGVFDIDFTETESKGVDLDRIFNIFNEVVVADAAEGQNTAKLLRGNIVETPFYSSVVDKWYHPVYYELFKNYNFADPASNHPIPRTQYTLDLATGNITFTVPLSAGDVIRANYSFFVPSQTVRNPTSLGNFVRVEIGKYQVSGIASQSSNFHFGMHPSDELNTKFGGLGMLVVDSTTAGVYDTVYIDMNNDRVFTPADVKVDRDNPVARFDNFNSTAAGIGDTANRTTPDGYPDISAGMIYYISDGVTPLPYSERYCQLWKIDDGSNNKTPANGALVAFMGEFIKDARHGTMTASRLVGQGNLDELEVNGICPDAKIIPIGGKKGRTDVITSWYFAVEGYDGIVGTGDEAQVVVNGFDYPTLYETGWDDYSRMADYIAMVHGKDNALFVMSSGDIGSGYGTVTSPGAAPGVLTVGPATDYYFLSDQAGGSEGENYHYGDITSYASKGPTAQGLPKPDCVAISSSFVSLPLNLFTDGTKTYTTPLPWSGSDHSCAVASGVSILVYQAYFEKNGRYPSGSTVKNLIMAGSDDLNYDVLSQGAGFINAKRSVMMAARLGGISASHDFWAPGDYKGSAIDAFTPIMVPGQSITDTMRLHNHGNSPVDVTVSDFIFDKTGEYTYSDRTTDKLDYTAEMGGILEATLNVRYSAGANYMGTAPVRWGLRGEEMHETDIIPAAGDDNVDASFDLFYNGVNSIEKVSWLQVEFNNTCPGTAADSSVSFDVVNVTVRYATLNINTGLGIAEQFITTFDAVPDGVSAEDNTTDDLSDVQNPDAVGPPPNTPVGGDGWYTVPRDRVMFFNEFDMSPMGVNEQVIFAVALEVRYSVDDGYSGTNPLMWSLDDGAPWFHPRDNGTATSIVPAAGQVGHDATFDLYAAGITSVWDISRLNLFFENNDGGMGLDAVSFDYVGLTVKYRGLNAIQVDGMPLTTPPFPVGFETVETVKLKCNEIGPFDSAKDLLSDLQIRDNDGPTPGDVAYDDGLYTIAKGFQMHVGSFESVVITPDIVDWYSPEDMVLWLNGSGLHKVNPRLADISENYPQSILGISTPPGLNFAVSYPNAPRTVVPAVPGLWENADMVRITAYTNYSEITMLDQGAFNHTYALSLLNWAWNESYYTNGITTTPVYFPCTSSDASYGMHFPKDLNTVEQSIITSNVLELRLSIPASKIKDGLVLNLKPLSEQLSEPGTEWHFKVEFFEKADWSWLQINSQAGAVDITVPVAGINFTATATVPANVGIGSYQGGIQIENKATGDITTIPVLINVASLTNTFEFGGTWPDYEDLYNNTIVLGGYDLAFRSGTESRARPYTGDRRYYFFDIPNQGLYANSDDINYRLVVEAEWNLKPSDIDILLLSKKRALDQPAREAPNRYGLYTLENKGGSEEMSGVEFFTATNSSKEVIAPELTPGLNVLMLHGVIIDGTADSHEVVKGRSSEVMLSSDVFVVTPDAAGTAPVSFWSNTDWDGISTSAVGPAITESYEDLEVKQDYEPWWNFPNWGEWNMMGSYTWWVNLSSCLILEVHIIGHDDASDLDLAVFRDLNGDGELSLDEVQDVDCINYGGSNWIYDADADADEKITWVNPPDGEYIIKVIGFTTHGTISTGEPGGHFDMTISQTLDTGSGYEMVGTNEDDILIIEEGDDPSEDITAIPAFQTTTFDVFWNFPGSVGDGDYGGAVMVGTMDAPGLVVIPMRVSLDRTAPIIEDIMPEDKLVTNNPMATIFASFKDEDRGELKSAKLYVNGVDMTAFGRTSIAYDEEAKGQGFALGSISYEPVLPFGDGTHRIDLEVFDWAGNKATKTWTFTVDTMSPGISMLSPTESTVYVNTPTFTVRGITDRGSVLGVIGVPATLETREDGHFMATLDLTDGLNNVLLTSTDSVGNRRTKALDVILDTEAPTFTRVVALDGSYTNKRMTGIYGEMSERGALSINGIPVHVNSDGTFRFETIQLAEGQNMQVLEFTDRAGNTAYNYLNITLDTVAPQLMLAGVENTVYSETLNITGTTEANTASLTINGKPVNVDNAGNFRHNVWLSPGSNTIVVESKDRAGNSAQETLTVNYVTDHGQKNWAAIGLMIALLVVGLILGLFLGPMILGGKKEEIPAEDVPVADGDVPEGEVPEGEAPADDGIEPVPEDIPGEEMPQEEGEIPESEIAEPIPAEESIPEEMPQETEEIPRAEPEMAPEPAEPEDPRITKLREAYEAGKISKDLYEKNLARFKNQ